MPFGVVRRRFLGVNEDDSAGHAVKRSACCEHKHLFLHHGKSALHVLSPNGTGTRRVYAMVRKCNCRGTYLASSEELRPLRCWRC